MLATILALMIIPLAHRLVDVGSRKQPTTVILLKKVALSLLAVTAQLCAKMTTIHRVIAASPLSALLGEMQNGRLLRDLVVAVVTNCSLALSISQVIHRSRLSKKRGRRCLLEILAALRVGVLTLAR